MGPQESNMNFRKLGGRNIKQYQYQETGWCNIKQYQYQYQESGWAEKADYAECLVLITRLQTGTQEVRIKDINIHI